MMTNEKMAIRTARNLVKSLNEKGVKCSSDFKMDKVRNILRESWYVKKLCECGCTECIHINLECGGFIAVTDDCKLMSGFNVMIHDAISNIFLEYVDEDYGYEPYETTFGKYIKTYCDEFGDNGMFLLEPSAFVSWVESLNFYEYEYS